MVTLEQVAKEIGISVKYLRGVLANRNKFYQSYYIPKRRCKERQIDAPNYEIKSIQNWILNNFLNKSVVHERAIGYIKNKSIKDNARFHINNKFIMCLDIQNFFSSIKVGQVKKIFSEIIENNEKLVNDFVKACTFKDYLPQGGVTSPMLSNLVFKVADNEIFKLCMDRNINYSRYSDDMTFSCNNFKKLKEIIPLIEKIIKKYNFNLNKPKTRFLTGKGRKIVTGIILNSGRMTIGRKRKRNIRAMMHNLIVKKSFIQNNKIAGNLAFLKDIEPSYYEKMINGYKKKLIMQANKK